MLFTASNRNQGTIPQESDEGGMAMNAEPSTMMCLASIENTEKELEERMQKICRDEMSPDFNSLSAGNSLQSLLGSPSTLTDYQSMGGLASVGIIPLFLKKRSFLI